MRSSLKGASLAAALNRPFIVLFEQERTDETHDGIFIGEDADHVGASFDLAVEAFERIEKLMKALW
jgi:hypothetical protein